MPAVTDPSARQTRMALRRAVLDLRVSERRRSFPPVLHVGMPGGLVFDLEHRCEGPVEHGLRADLVAACLSRARTAAAEPLVWLTRTGDFVLEDPDAAWLSAARSAYAEANVPLTMVVVTRRGWWDPRSGARREWKRLRQR